MDIRWVAVFIGFMADYVISALLVLLANPAPEFSQGPDFRRADHIVLFVLLLLSTGTGGYVAGRIARSRLALHGMLVGVVGILYGQLALMGGNPAPGRAFVLGSLAGCALGALGGLISGWQIGLKTPRA
jgi:putative membrane protein (TIGR04086 family)